MLQLLRRVALIEAGSFLLLVVATIVKHGLDKPVFVTYVGPVHGLAFLAYLALVLMCWGEQKWTAGRVGILLLLSVVPLGGFIAERKILGPAAAAGVVTA